MSAESPRRNSKPTGHMVRPQPVSDKSFLESVTGFINDVVPQAYTNSMGDTHRDIITWARFESTDLTDPSFYPDLIDGSEAVPPLLLVLGYTTGVQVWSIPSNGEAQEVLSWRQGIVRTLRLLPHPQTFFGTNDNYGNVRPLVAICDGAGGHPFCTVAFVSLRSGDQVKTIKFQTPVSDIIASRRVVVVTFPEKIAVFDACTLEDRFTVSSCHPSPGPNPNPVCLGSRWLAFADKKLHLRQQSCGGMEGEGTHSYTATVIHAAKSLTKGLKELGETVASSITGQKGQCQSSIPQQSGVVTILDILAVGRGEVDSREQVIAHFIAHSQPLVAMCFDPSGTLLLTADKQGHDFHLFRIQPHPMGVSSVHHLYVLHRGDTSSKVQDMAFSLDSRWVAVSTVRGTTHIFPITPYGGSVSVRTHTTHRVVNRLSRFHRSAGLDDTPPSGRNSPVLSSSPGSPRSFDLPYHNPRLPPYPHPTIQNPLAQLRQPILSTALTTTPRSPSITRSRPGHVAVEEVKMKLAAMFAAPRGWVGGSPSITTKEKHKPMEGLFVIACHGNLIEYTLEPKPHSNSREKVCDDSPIELEVRAKAQWSLLRTPLRLDMQPPLPLSNPLLTPPPSPHTTHCNELSSDDQWLSQVEIVTHTGPPRRLWMGPQFSFKKSDQRDSHSSHLSPSKPVAMPSVMGSIVPVVIEGGSLGSMDPSPRMNEMYGDDFDQLGGIYNEMESQLRDNIADAMIESPITNIRDTGCVDLMDEDIVREASLRLVVGSQDIDQSVVDDENHVEPDDNNAVMTESRNDGTPPQSKKGKKNKKRRK